LRGRAALARDFTGAVMARLDTEPVVLAPRARPRQQWQRSLTALAASLAGIAVVGWLGLVPQERNALPEATLARADQQAVAVAAKAQPAADKAMDKGMREYLAAHEAYAGGLQLHGGAQRIRTVSMAVSE